MALNANVEVSSAQPPDTNDIVCLYSSISGDPTHNDASPATGKTNGSFVFSASKEKKGVKPVAWKRLARGPMEEKGVHHMDLDHSDTVKKRKIDGSLVHDDDGASKGCNDCDGAMKHQKISSSHDLVSICSAEVGNDQPRQIL